jgi:hypothetical protein
MAKQNGFGLVLQLWFITPRLLESRVRLNTGDNEQRANTRESLLLPGALLMAMQAQLLTAFMFVNFRFTAFFQ